MYEINETHDPNLRSWVESANAPNTDFPIQNLPFCILDDESKEHPDVRIGVVIGDSILDLDSCFEAGLITGAYYEALGVNRLWSTLDGVMRLEPTLYSALRKRVQEILSFGFPEHKV